MEHTILDLKKELDKLDFPIGTFNLLDNQRQKETIKQKIRKIRDGFLKYETFENKEDLVAYVENVCSEIIHAYVDDKNNCIKAIFYKNCDFETAMYFYWSADVYKDGSYVEIYIPKEILGKFIGRSGFNVSIISSAHAYMIKVQPLDQLKKELEEEQ